MPDGDCEDSYPLAGARITEERLFHKGELPDGKTALG
jgi:hypothetical protein